MAAAPELEAEQMTSSRRAALTLLLCAALLAPPPLAAQGLADLNQTPTLGDTFPGFDTQGVDGKPRKIAYPKGTTTVLLFFLSSCPTCHRMIPEWNRAFEKRAKGVEIVGVILDREPPGFFTAMPVSFPVVRLPQPDFARANKVNRVPLTMRLTEGGKIDDLALGHIDPIRVGELFRP
jgi:thiol-disulfide isomerase/thioredoxin